MSTQTQPAPRGPIAAPEEPPIRGRGKSHACPLVLVVNTEAVTLEALYLTLEFEGFSVHQAPAPAPALALLEREDFAVILADHELLVRDQSDLLSRTAIRQPYASIVALSSVFTVNQAMAQGSAGRLFGFVTKPWLREELIATIAAGVAVAHTRKENAGLQRNCATSTNMPRNSDCALRALTRSWAPSSRRSKRKRSSGSAGSRTPNTFASTCSHPATPPSRPAANIY